MGKNLTQDQMNNSINVKNFNTLNLNSFESSIDSSQLLLGPRIINEGNMNRMKYPATQINTSVAFPSTPNM